MPVINTNGDGEIQASEAVAFTGAMIVSSKNIVDMTGVEAFVNMSLLDCQHNLITLLPVSGLTGLQELKCSYNSFTSLNLNNLPSLWSFDCRYSLLTSLIISGLPSLSALVSSYNNLTALSITNTPNLSRINCEANQLISFNLSPQNWPITINCHGNKLTTLPLNSTPRLYTLNCSGNLLSSLPLNNLNELRWLDCSGNQLSSLVFPNPSGLEMLWCYYNQLTSLPSGLTSLKSLVCNNNQLNSLPVGMNILENLNCSNNQLTSLPINDLNTPSLRLLKFGNNLITNFSLNNKPFLQEIVCDSNLLSMFSISNMPALTDLDCSSNQIAALSLNNFPSLRNLTCRHNQLFTLQLTNLPASFIIDADYNNLTVFSLNNLPTLTGLYISNNKLSSLTLSNLPSLYRLSCTKNRLTELDLSRVPVKYLDCDDNPDLLYINIKNNAITTTPPYYLFVTGDNMLEAICVDSAELVNILTRVNTQLPGQNISVSSTFCNFTPTGNYNTIVGTVRFDQNLSGCNNTDSTMAYVKVNISDALQSGTTFTNNRGNYKFLTQFSPDTVSTDFPNNWFTVSPLAHFISFTGYGNIAVADFCASANGIHPDLDIVLLPLTGAQAGFDAGYRMVYSNKGNQTQSGNISLDFDASKLNFVSAIPGPLSQTTGHLIWTYTNLSPYQSRSIDIKFHVSPPPVVNGGDILNFVATVDPITSDETPADNVFNLNQVAMNSWDPNDKLVTEGSQVTIDKAQDFLHYLVRFQNTGTASAISVVIKDSLADNLDWNSFTPITASHSYRTVVTKGNKIEFIFDGINLPGKDMNEPASHGFVAFKIKPKSTITIGETIYNKAAIYFDYNLPIITNTVSTTIINPAKAEDPIGLVISPNPVNNYLQFTVRPGIQVTSVNLYNSGGGKVYTEAFQNLTTSKKINISHLPNGILFLEVISLQGRSVQKVVKLR